MTTRVKTFSYAPFLVVALFLAIAMFQTIGHAQAKKAKSPASVVMHGLTFYNMSV
jgi:hypothetical protein